MDNGADNGDNGITYTKHSMNWKFMSFKSTKKFVNSLEHGNMYFMHKTVT